MGLKADGNTNVKRKQSVVTLTVLMLFSCLVSSQAWGGAAATLTVWGNMIEESCNIEVNGQSFGAVNFPTHLPGDFTDNGGTAEVQTLIIRTENCSLPGASGVASIVVSAGSGTAAMAGGTVFTNDAGDQSAGFMLRELGMNGSGGLIWPGTLNDFYNTTASDTMKNGNPGPDHNTDDQTGPGQSGDLTSGTSLEYAVGFVATNGVNTPNSGGKYKANLLISFHYH